MKDLRMEALRRTVKSKGIIMYQVAETIGIHASTLCVWFRSYNEDHYNKILKAIERIERGEDHDEDHQESK